ncbi:hypothetical protein OHR86_29610 [Streptomyces sp. NBC_00441]|uniref:hypothetical protein n=1 Tax=Streptomyces sp. NBC_00441 TaxID=2975742 RepID=UPI002E2A5853|nr:hypothetical protein [Streptomyces sp. NBC_00441]
MTPLPGQPPGNAHPGRSSAARQYLVALLLAVLALVGGAPAAAGEGLPVRVSAGLPTTPAPGLPVRHATGQTTVERSALPTDAEAPRTVPPAAATPPPATVDRGPDTTPWAAAEHPRTAHQLPPPGPGGLVPSPARAPLPRSVPWLVRTAPASAVQRPRVALPGVRGPPSAGVHRPGDRSPVPQSINAVPLPPS